MDFLLVNLKHKGSQSWIVSDETDLAIPNFNLASTEVTPLCLVTPQCCKNNNNHGISQHPQPIKNQSLAFWPPHCRGTSVNSHSAIGALRRAKKTSLAVSSSTGKKVRNSLSLSLHDDIAAWCYNYATYIIHLTFCSCWIDPFSLILYNATQRKSKERYEYEFGIFHRKLKSRKIKPRWCSWDADAQ